MTPRTTMWLVWEVCCYCSNLLCRGSSSSWGTWTCWHKMKWDSWWIGQERCRKSFCGPRANHEGIMKAKITSSRNIFTDGESCVTVSGSHRELLRGFSMHQMVAWLWRWDWWLAWAKHYLEASHVDWGCHWFYIKKVWWRWSLHFIFSVSVTILQVSGRVLWEKDTQIMLPSEADLEACCLSVMHLNAGVFCELLPVNRAQRTNESRCSNFWLWH